MDDALVLLTASGLAGVSANPPPTSELCMELVAAVEAAVSSKPALATLAVSVALWSAHDAAWIVGAVAAGAGAA